MLDVIVQHYRHILPRDKRVRRERCFRGAPGDSRLPGPRDGFREPLIRYIGELAYNQFSMAVPIAGQVEQHLRKLRPGRVLVGLKPVSYTHLALAK